ncbi:sensor histidine kinase [Maribacter flavus]|uniref:histidine kinase n=1 Tax=Maribacter flavus TaxID=1658664 RepID=A0A5B2TQS1_9FLAO|nr:HAMP domain-containing sensor histidine kinase [Maribacter flavus]KAA2216644.1 HAMP domain-containing histidine kinase [Maribacter flavus]
MHSLLKRQLRKYLPNEEHLTEEMTQFLDAVQKSYENFDEKFYMLQRASTISSEELFEANQRLEKEAVRQKAILTDLESAIESLSKNLQEKEVLFTEGENGFNAEYLAKNISNLASRMSDMTAEKDRLLKDLEEQNKSLNNYAQMVSHDLKSPIRNINALMSWIVDEEKEKFSDISKNNCSLVSQNLEKMDKLISGILKHATLGQTQEQPVSFELRNLLEEIQRTIYIPENVSVTFGEELPTMTFEKERLKQLFMNLITNAVKATEDKENGIISINYEPDDTFWKFSIADNGKGIPKCHQEGVFEMFKKLENDVLSTGIGLAIVKKIIELYEGEICLESEEDRGTTFYFTLKK